MNHRKTWFFFSGLYITIELAVLVVFLFAGGYVGYVVAGAMAVFVCFEVFRIYRKTQVIARGHHLTDEQKLKQASYKKQLSGYGHYYNVWYRFADSSEQEYMANKFHEVLKKTRRK
jgi:hypothetical protein